MSIARRLFLRGIAAAPVLAKATSELVPMANMGLGLECKGISPLSGMGASAAGINAYRDAGGNKITSYAQWLFEGGEAEIRKRAGPVQTLDADLMGMRLPLPTLVRMQRDRNLVRIREELRQTIELRLKAGPFTWWFE